MFADDEDITLFRKDVSKNSRKLAWLLLVREAN